MLRVDKITIRRDAEFTNDRIYVKGDEGFNALNFDEQYDEVMGAMPELLGMLGLADRVEHITFSRHAGCSDCPCSPGFVVNGSRRGVAVWVDFVTTAPCAFEAEHNDEPEPVCDECDEVGSACACEPCGTFTGRTR